MKDLVSRLLYGYLDALLNLQVKKTGEKLLDGALLCPACAHIHGRCFELLQPLVFAYSDSGKEEYLSAAEAIFAWAEHTVSCPDGSYLNDIGSDWKGTTVFACISLAEVLENYRSQLPEAFCLRISQRLEKALDFICVFKALEKNNINYQIGAAYALALGHKLFSEEKYAEKADFFLNFLPARITDSGLLSGEGGRYVGRGKPANLPVDIGYNVEETLLCLALLAELREDDKLKDTCFALLDSHQAFFLPDGGLDNSFGSRNYKWTYWGSRTTDGGDLAYLMYASRKPSFLQTVRQHLEQLEKCSTKGLLCGGPHYLTAGEPACIHHSFTRAKALAGMALYLQNHPLSPEVFRKDIGPAAKWQQEEKEIKYYPEISTYLIRNPYCRATVTAYDWLNSPTGHASGGSLSLLYLHGWGVVFSAGLNQYERREPFNMQIVRSIRHECLTPRIEWENEGEVYSSLYDTSAEMHLLGERIEVFGTLKNKSFEPACCAQKTVSYRFVYIFEEQRVSLYASAAQGHFICPVISPAGEALVQDENLSVRRDGKLLKLRARGSFDLPYGENRIFQLCPGFQALKCVFPLGQAWTGFDISLG